MLEENESRVPGVDKKQQPVPVGMDGQARFTPAFPAGCRRFSKLVVSGLRRMEGGPLCREAVFPWRDPFPHTLGGGKIGVFWSRDTFSLLHSPSFALRSRCGFLRRGRRPGLKLS